MSPLELYDHIHCWLWLYEHTPFPASSDPNVIEFIASANQTSKIELLTDVAQWEVPLYLVGTSIADDLQTAIGYARSANRTNISDIHRLLLNVSKYLTENHLNVNPPDRN